MCFLIIFDKQTHTLTAHNCAPKNERGRDGPCRRQRMPSIVAHNHQKIKHTKPYGWWRWPNWKRRIFDCQFVVSTRIQPLQRGTLNGSQSLQGTQYPFINGANALPPSLGIAGPQWIFLIFFAAFCVFSRWKNHRELKAAIYNKNTTMTIQRCVCLNVLVSDDESYTVYMDKQVGSSDIDLELLTLATSLIPVRAG